MLNSQSIEYKTRRSKRARCVRLSVYANGDVVVTLPQKLSLQDAQKFIISKSKWILSKLEYYKSISVDKTFNLGGGDYIKHKDKILALVKARIEHYNQNYGFRYNSLKIKNQKTRWGSCSNKKNLNFNFRIGFLPDDLRDYIIVHELCHLKEMNHSRRFWRLVEKTFPNHKDLRKEVRVYGFRYF